MSDRIILLGPGVMAWRFYVWGDIESAYTSYMDYIAQVVADWDGVASPRPADS